MEKENVVLILKKVLKKKGVVLSDEQISKLVEIPPNSDMGDFSFPCFVLSEKLKDNPHQIAIELREDIGKFSPEDFEDIQTKGPYLNFFLNKGLMAKKLISETLNLKNDYGKTNIGKGKKILVEHTSINPNASPHVGRARNAIIGDSMVRIYDFLGFKPEVHYYVNDISKQIAMLVVAKAEKLSFDKMLNTYIKISKQVADSKKMEAKVFSELNKFESGDKKTLAKFKKITETCVQGQAKILKRIGIDYDVFDFESSYLEESKDILQQLKKTGKLLADENGRLYINQEGTQLEKMMKAPVLVLTRSDGTGLYPLRDIAYTLYKMKISDNNIIVLGEDQKLYFLQIKEALNILKAKSPEVLHYSFILLSSTGKSRKMSTRKGDVVLLETFLNELILKAKKEIKKRKTEGQPEIVATAALKYKILKNAPNKVIQFDTDEALSFDGDTGPYLLYSYARASSIIKKSKISKSFDIPKLEEKEYELVKKLSQFQDTVISAHKNLNPSLIANYSYQLAQTFNDFYQNCKVIGSKEEDFRLALVQSFRQVLKNSLLLLGIETVEKM